MLNSLVYQLQLEGYSNTLHKIQPALVPPYHHEVSLGSNLKETIISYRAPPCHLALQVTTCSERSNLQLTIENHVS